MQDTRAPQRHPEKDTGTSSSSADEPYHLDLSDWDNVNSIDEPGSDIHEDLHL